MSQIEPKKAKVCPRQEFGYNSATTLTLDSETWFNVTHRHSVHEVTKLGRYAPDKQARTDIWTTDHYRALTERGPNKSSFSISVSF